MRLRARRCERPPGMRSTARGPVSKRRAPGPEPKRNNQGTLSILPMQLHIGDRYSDETGEWEVVSRPVSFRGGKSVRARVQILGKPETEREGSRAFLSAVERAQAALKDAGKDATGLRAIRGTATATHSPLAWSWPVSIF